MVIAMVMVMDTTAGMVVMAGMVVTGVAIIMVGVVGVGEDWVGAAGEVRRININIGAIRIMGMGTIHITDMATIAPITATIVPTTTAGTTVTIAPTVTTATTVGTMCDITGSTG